MTSITESDWDMDSYARLTAELAELKEADPLPDNEATSYASSFLVREARMLDSGDFEGWLELMAPDCVYWIPANPEGGDPTTEVSLAFDDHRRLTDRVYWLRTGLVSAQLPPSRTRRLITNVEAWRGDEGSLLVRSNFMLHEFRAGRQRILSGWYGHVLTTTDAPDIRSARIRTKVIVLTDSDQGHDNLTLVF